MKGGVKDGPPSIGLCPVASGSACSPLKTVPQAVRQSMGHEVASAMVFGTDDFDLPEGVVL